MLIIKVFVNTEEIDEICIQNTKKKIPDGDTIYRIVKPQGLEKYVLFHRRGDDYEQLLEKSLQVIQQQCETLNTRRLIEAISPVMIEDIGLEVEGDEISACHAEESQCESGRDRQHNYVDITQIDGKHETVSICSFCGHRKCVQKKI